jgi:hypothetical protein
MIFAPTDFALVNFNCLFSTTDLDRGALQKQVHCLSAEHSPVCNSMTTDGKILYDFLGFIAMHDVVRNQHNFQEGEFTPREP